MFLPKKMLIEKGLSNDRVVKRAGPYLIGPRLGTSPVSSITQCLARKSGSEEFYTLKMLILKPFEEETEDDTQGKMLLLTEYSLLSLLHEQKGVVHHHGLFKDLPAVEESAASPSTKLRRLNLVLDCLAPHDFDNRSHNYVNLQQHVIKEKKLMEQESLLIFREVVMVVNNLHQLNIVHRDLKLGNLVLHRQNRHITITNFCLGKHLVSEDDLLRDQRGSPAYISPDVLSGRPYLGKPSDLWALGVVLFTMLYGQFPFYDSVPQELFRKIKAAEFSIPKDGRVSDNTTMLVRYLLNLNPHQRLKASKVVDFLDSAIASNSLKSLIKEQSLLQVVPDIDAEIANDKLRVVELSKTDSSESDFERILRQLQAVEESTDNILAYHSGTVAGLPPFEGHRLAGHDNSRVHPNILSSIVCQGTVRNLSPAQMNRYRHLLPPRLTSSHHQYHEHRSSQRMTSASASSTTSASYQNVIAPFVRSVGANNTALPGNLFRNRFQDPAALQGLYNANRRISIDTPSARPENRTNDN